MAASKLLPRFVPTLTEVVHPGLPVASPAVDPEQLAEQVLRIVRPKLEQQLRAYLQAMVEQHMRAAAPRMQHDLEEAVKFAVAQSLGGLTRTKD